MKTILSKIFQFVVFFRNKLFDWRILPVRKVSVPVISVGNIVAGGTGKTPFTMLLAKKIQNYAVLSRGYRSEATKLRCPVIVYPGDDPQFCGDEPALFLKNFPDAMYVVGANRYNSAKLAIKKGAKVLILDDGFQHRYLHRDLNIVIIDAHDPFGGGCLLPKGMLREPPESLKRADIIVLNHVKDISKYKALTKEIKQYTKASIISTDVVVEGVFMQSGEEISLKDKRIVAFCALGKPDYFLKTLRNLGAEIVKTCFLSDHTPFTNEKLQELYNEDSLLVCTEKDIVKIKTDIPIAYVKINLQITHGENMLLHNIEEYNEC